MSYLSRRRNALMKMGGEDDGYIKDGLVFWLVGTDATSTNWIDRIGGLNFAMQNIAFTENGGVVFNGSSSQGRAEGVYNAPILECTIEVVFKKTGNSTVLILSPHSSTNCMTFGLNGTYCICSNSNYLWAVGAICPKDTNNTMSICYDKQSNDAYPSGYNNKAPITVASRDYYGIGSGNYTTLGYRTESNRNWFNGVLYQIRIYNRHLADDEMLHNQSIDMERYNIS